MGNGTEQLGAWVEGEWTYVRTWAPEHRRLVLHLYSADGQRSERTFEMTEEPGGYFSVKVAHGSAPFLYKIEIDREGPFPDPWSRGQPFGVHGPSSLEPGVSSFTWTDHNWKGITVEDPVIYELHVGTATPEGTFESLIPRLTDLKQLGIDVIELLPVATFPGQRNWGYDGVFLFAPAQVYGGALGLKRLIDAAHQQGLGVIIDAVYNHFGPEGNYLRAYSPSYFTKNHSTPWGDAINYDGKGSEVVRELPLRNVEMWIREFHADGLRLDATHAIIDESPEHLLRALTIRARKAAGDRKILIVAEDERNDARVPSPVSSKGGFGLDAVWADDLHHQLRRAFAGDSEGYYRDYTGSAADIAQTLNQGWFYTGQKSINLNKYRGTPVDDLPATAFVHCIQNHDQIGNRPYGNRLADDVSDAAFRAMTTLLLTSPFVPMIYAGQEWNSRTPFLYFTDHSPELGRAVTEGRRREFAAFLGFQGKGAEVPDPQAEQTFRQSQLNWEEATRPGHREIRELHRKLLKLRKEHPALKTRSRQSFRCVSLTANAFVLERRGDGRTLQIIVNIRGQHVQPLNGAKVLLSSEDKSYGGAGAPPPSSRQEITLKGPQALILEALDSEMPSPSRPPSLS